jgi:hypothetical protein
MYKMFGISDPIHKLVLTLVINALCAVFKDKPEIQPAHWITPQIDSDDDWNIFDTQPKFRARRL